MEIIKDEDIICISESWHINKDNLPIPNKLEMIDSLAIKTAKWGRAAGGLIITFNSNIYKNIETLYKSENYIFIKLNISSKVLIIGLVYVSPLKDLSCVINTIDEILTVIRNKFKEAEIIIGGDFNARVATENEIDPDRLPSEAVCSRKRKSRDTKIDKRGRDILDLCDRNEIYIMNGRFPGDEEGEFTFIGSQGRSVNDLILCNFLALNNTIDFKILDELTKSEHKIACILLNKSAVIKNKVLKTIKWKEKYKDHFFEYMENSSKVGLTNVNANEMADYFKNTVIEIADNLNMYTKNSNFIIIKKNPSFDEECRELKKKVERACLKAKKLEISKNELHEVIKIKNWYYF